MRRFLVGLAGLLLSTALIGQVKYSNEFLKIGVGAKTLAMGGAGIALVSDATAGYWNPSRLLEVSGPFNASLMHAEYFAGLAKYDFGSIAYSIDDQSALGVSIIRLGVDDIPNTLELIDADGNMRYDRIKTFSAADMAVLFSYARKMPVEGLSAGLNAKVVYRRTGDFANAWGFGFDASATLKRGSWILAAVARDVTTTFNAWKINSDQLEEVFAVTGNDIPENSIEMTMPSLIIAASRTFRINDDFKAIADLDLHFSLDGERPVLLSFGYTGIDPYLGSELVFKDWLSFRMGVGQFQWITGMEAKKVLTLQPAVGLGVRFKRLQIDYALTDPGDISVAQYSNILSFSYQFGK